MAVTAISDVQLGKLTQIAFSEGVFNQLSENYKEFEMIKAQKTRKAGVRSFRFLFQDSYGPAAVQYRNASSDDFVASQEVSVSEKEAFYKELSATVSIRYNLWKRLQNNPEKYADSLSLELAAKQIAMNRRIASDLFDDGTGVLCVVSSASVNSGVVTVNVSPTYSNRGSIGRIEIGDLVLIKTTAAAARTPTVSSGTFYAYKVTGKTRSATAPSFTCVAVNSAGTQLTATDVGSAASTDVVYRVGQPTFADLTAITVGTTEMGTLTDVMAGLPSLISDDGRLIHGIVMSGASKASNVDLGGSTVIDPIHIHQAMDDINLATGMGTFKYSKVLAAPEAIRAFIEAREVDRRFQSVQDNTRGTTKFVYQHLNNALELLPSEFSPIYSMWIMPDASGANAPLQFHMSDMEMVKQSNKDSGFHLGVSSNGHTRHVKAYFEGCMALINCRPNATSRITGFTLS